MLRINLIREYGMGAVLLLQQINKLSATPLFFFFWHLIQRQKCSLQYMKIYDVYLVGLPGGFVLISGR